MQNFSNMVEDTLVAADCVSKTHKYDPDKRKLFQVTRHKGCYTFVLVPNALITMKIWSLKSRLAYRECGALAVVKKTKRSRYAANRATQFLNK